MPNYRGTKRKTCAEFRRFSARRDGSRPPILRLTPHKMGLFFASATFGMIARAVLGGVELFIFRFRMQVELLARPGDNTNLEFDEFQIGTSRPQVSRLY